MKHFTQGLLLAGVLAFTASESVSAQFASRVAPQNSVIAKAKSEAAAKFRLPAKQNAAAPLKVVGPVDPTQYGTTQDIITEDFSKMATGSEEDPDMKTNVSYQNDDNAWINMKGDYTHEFGWGSHSAYPAGGCVYLETDGKSGAQVNTPMLDLSGQDGVFFVRFRARTPWEEDVAKYAVVEAAETNNMGPSWDICDTYTYAEHYLPAITNEWQTYEIMFYGGGPTTLINIVAQDVPILVDDIEVFQVDPYVGMPTANKHKHYEGTSFDLSWNATKNADKYLLNLYTVKADGMTPNDYILENQEVKGTEYTVTNADSGDTYYYTVTAVDAEGHKSFESNPVKIFDVAKPVLKAGQFSDGQFTASWDAVPAAERYNYLASYKRTAKEDGVFDVAKLNFVGLQWPEGTKDRDGNPAQVVNSVDNPDSNTLDQDYLKNMGQEGWKTTHFAVYKDALVLDGFWYVMNHSDAALTSPELDLSKDGGKMHLTMSLCGEEYEYEDEDGNTLVAFPRAAVALFNWDNEKDDYVQTELHYIDNIDNGWQDFDVDLTTGTSKSVLGVFATWSPTNLYLENLTLTQNFKKGESVLSPFLFKHWLNGTSVDVKVPVEANGSDIYHQANSVRVSGQSYYGSEFLESKWTDLTLAAENVTAGINDAKTVSLAKATVKLVGNQLVVNNPEHNAVYLYAADGSTVAADKSGAETVSLNAPAKGTYVVKVGKQTVKVCL